MFKRDTFMPALIAAAIFVFSGLPVLLTALLFGGAGFTDLALLFGGILLSAALAGSLGLFFSALNRTTAVAIVETLRPKPCSSSGLTGFISCSEITAARGTAQRYSFGSRRSV